MDDRDQMARDLIGCFPVLDKSDATDAEATGGPTTQIWQLREAARLMRERAGKATPGPWQSDGSEIHGDTIVDWIGETCDPDEPERTDANAAHIAGMHPAVALAVAAWLDTEAHMAERRGNSAEGQTFHALKVARAYLGAEHA